MCSCGARLARPSSLSSWARPRSIRCGRIPCVRIAAGSSGRPTSAADGTSPRSAAPAARCGSGRPRYSLRDAAHDGISPWLELSVSHAGPQGGAGSIPRVLCGFPRRYVAARGVPDARNPCGRRRCLRAGACRRQILPFEAYGDALRHCPAVMLLPDADLDALRRLRPKRESPAPTPSFTSPEVLEAVRAGRTQGVPELDSEQLRRALGSLPLLSFSDVVQALGLLRGTGALPGGAVALRSARLSGRRVPAHTAPDGGLLFRVRL